MRKLFSVIVLLGIGAAAFAQDVKLSDKEFHCRGKFTALHSGHPDEADIAAAKAFARKVRGDKK